MALDSYTFRIDSSLVDGRTRLMVSGVIDEHADLNTLSSARGDVEVVMKGVRRINSFGVRAWIDAIRRIPGDTRLSFVECPPPVVDQMNMVQGLSPGSSRRARISSSRTSGSRPVNGSSRMTSSGR